jgi:hypothetical protein
VISMIKAYRVLIALLGICLVSQQVIANEGARKDLSPQSQQIVSTEQPELWTKVYAALDIWFEERDRLFDLIPVSLGHRRANNDLLDDVHFPVAIAALNEFQALHGETLTSDSLRRAMLQRDLMNLFIWSEEFGLPSALDQRRHELQKELAKVIRNLQLSREEILNLPDNYSAAIASGQFAAAFDPKQPQKPFLPPDLFSPDGDWVLLEDAMSTEPLAVFHRPVTLIFISIQDGRTATVAYLKRLREFPNPLRLTSREVVDSSTGLKSSVQAVLFSPDLPPLPAGTQAVLVHRAILIDNHGEPVPSPLTDSVQLRVYHSVDDYNSSTGTDDPPLAVFLYELAHVDPQFGRSDALIQIDVTPERRSSPLLECIHCHARPGIQSVNSYTRMSFDRPPKLGMLTSGDLNAESSRGVSRFRQSSGGRHLLELMR